MRGVLGGQLGVIAGRGLALLPEAVAESSIADVVALSDLPVFARRGRASRASAVQSTVWETFLLLRLGSPFSSEAFSSLFAGCCKCLTGNSLYKDPYLCAAICFFRHANGLQAQLLYSC